MSGLAPNVGYVRVKSRERTKTKKQKTLLAYTRIAVRARHATSGLLGDERSDHLLRTAPSVKAARACGRQVSAVARSARPAGRRLRRAREAGHVDVAARARDVPTELVVGARAHQLALVLQVRAPQLRVDERGGEEEHDEAAEGAQPDLRRGRGGWAGRVGRVGRVGGRGGWAGGAGGRGGWAGFSLVACDARVLARRRRRASARTSLAVHDQGSSRAIAMAASSTGPFEPSSWHAPNTHSSENETATVQSTACASHQLSRAGCACSRSGESAAATASSSARSASRALSPAPSPSVVKASECALSAPVLAVRSRRLSGTSAPLADASSASSETHEPLTEREARRLVVCACGLSRNEGIGSSDGGRTIDASARLSIACSSASKPIPALGKKESGSE